MLHLNYHVYKIGTKKKKKSPIQCELEIHIEKYEKNQTCSIEKC